MTGSAHLILYVVDQAAATAFWTAVLDRQPEFDVPGMTEFNLRAGTVLGLMPEARIEALLGPALPDPSSGRGVPRCEVYLVVADPAAHHARALAPEPANCPRCSRVAGVTRQRTASIRTATSWRSPAARYRPARRGGTRPGRQVGGV